MHRLGLEGRQLQASMLQNEGALLIRLHFLRLHGPKQLGELLHARETNCLGAAETIK
jgi:hypothetical protein